MWIDDRTVLHMLDAVRYVRIDRERRRLSFRALAVEQIGHVYEQLLAFDAYRARETVVGLDWGRNAISDVALSRLMSLGKPSELETAA